jgi:glycosyltransferase involved in cell wall biosynthesis
MYSLKRANELTREKKYSEALDAYEALLSSEANKHLSECIITNINYIKKKLGAAHLGAISREDKKNVTSHKFTISETSEVSDSDCAIEQAEYLFKNRKLKPGLTALIRARNAERFLSSAVLSLIDLVDEVVAVDNNSTDNTLGILQDLCKSYPNLKVYKYNIDIPAAGRQHAEAVAKGSTNTLGTFYNWCLSKVCTTNVLKWDADFVAIRANLEELIRLFDLKASSSNTSIWCTGATSFAGRVIRPDSWYDEFRIFSAAHGAKWENYQGCETIVNAINASEHCIVYGFNDDTRRISKEVLDIQKKASKPIFIEQKDTINLKNTAMILDARDASDNTLIMKYINLAPDYTRPNKLNEYKVLITIPSLAIGGGNYWAMQVFNQLSHLGISVDIGINDCSNQSEIMNTKTNGFYSIPIENLVFITKENSPRYESYTHILLSCPFRYPEYIKRSSRVFVFTHSDVSYINQYALDSGYIPVSLNKVTLKKFSAKNRCSMLLNNYIAPSPSRNTKEFDAENITILYCNRISFDKNVPMLLLAIKYLLNIDEYARKIKLTLLAGGAESSVIEYKTIIAAINKLDLGEYVEILTSQKNVEQFYMSHDFCILTSVSEGCSYGLLEAVNYGIPIVTTGIEPNYEITEGLMPSFQLPGIQQRSNNMFCIENYNHYLYDIGYVKNDAIHSSNETVFLFERLYNRFVTNNDPTLQEAKPAVYVPYLLPEISNSLIEMEYIECIKQWGLYDDLAILSKEDQSAVLNKKVKEIKSNLEEYLKYWERQSEIFTDGAHSIANAMNEMINNFKSYKSNISELRRRKHEAYFSVENNRKQLYTLLFSDDFIFE